VPAPHAPASKSAPRRALASRLRLPIALAITSGAGLLWWLSRPAGVPEEPSPMPSATVQTSSPVGAGSADSLADVALPDAPSPIDPREPLRAYAGRKRCAECHREEHARWTKDWHARALSPATSEYVAGKYDDAHFKGASSEAWMSRKKGKYVMRTAGKDGTLATYAVDWVIGGKRMQDALTIQPDGRWQILPVYYHVTGKGEWVDYTEAKQGGLGADHPFFWTNFRRTANHECLDCHTSGLEVTYDRATRRMSTRMIDPGVACESCHGPGARHAETQDPADVLHPGKAPAEIGLALCGQCHGPRQPLYPMLDAAHHFVPGQRYEAHFMPHGIVTGNGRSGDFFADGRPSASSFEYQALIQSRCHLEGKATCLTCHTAPHAKEQDADEMKPPKDGSLKGTAREEASACLGCHAPVFADQGHSHHRSPEGQSCLGCHMPKVVTGVLDTFADHAIDIPVPENTQNHEVPNACNLCHTDRTPAEMARAMDGFWPGASKRRQRRIRLADAFDEKTKQESQPALRAVVADAGEAPLLRATAAQLLAQRFPAGADTVIVPLLSSADPLLRTRAAEALAMARAKGAADALVRRGQDPSLFVREAAAIALSEVRDPRAMDALTPLTRSPPASTLPRPHALLALALIQRNQFDAAMAEAERAVDLQFYYIDPLILLADLYARRQELDRTHALLEEALSFDPQHPAARKRLRILMTDPSGPSGR
jgi:hypothetical protein